jgi:hypothetical protein
MFLLVVSKPIKTEHWFFFWVGITSSLVHSLDNFIYFWVSPHVSRKKGLSNLGLSRKVNKPDQNIILSKNRTRILPNNLSFGEIH